MTTTTVLFL